MRIFPMIRMIAAITTSCLAALALQGCRHPLAIVGEGDIVELNGSGRGCSLEQFRAQHAACVENDVSGDYFVNYEARPRPGWRFVRWEGPCGGDSDFGHCRLQVPADMVKQWDASEEDAQAPASTAVFQPVSGETGYLLAGTPVAGVAYTTPTRQGVTGLDGSFQYAEGERVRFTVGATTLGEVAGQPQVTPFELAGSPILRGIRIAWALRDENDPFQQVVNLTVLLHSLDRDGIPGNGIVITRGIAELLAQVKLELHQQVNEFASYHDSEGGTMLVAQDWENFLANPTLRHLLGRANRGQRFSAPHGVTPPAIAVSRLYRTLSIEPGIFALDYQQTGNPEDGENWARYAYDDAGHLIEHEISGFGGAKETWQYNERGQVTLHQQDADEVDHHLTTVSSYDSRGNLIHSETQFGGNNAGFRGYRLEENNRYDRDSLEIRHEDLRTSEDGAETGIAQHSRSYDSRGRLAQYVSDSEQTYNDGSSFRSVEYYTYWHDAEGNLRSYSLDRDVNDVDGVPETQSRWWYDAQGRITRYESSAVISPRPGDEPPLLVWTWQYDASGKVTRHRAVEETWLFRYQYDDDGRTTRREKVNTANGAVAEVVTWSYDSIGRVARKEVTSFRTGSYIEPDLDPEVNRSTQAWQYHANGEVSLFRRATATQVSDLGASFEISEREEYQFDTGGKLTRYTSIQQFDFGDTPEQYRRTYTWQYDSAGNLVRAEMDDGGEPPVQAWQYDANGNPIRYQVDNDGDGTFEENTEYRYRKTDWGFLFAGVSPYGSNLPLPANPVASFDYIPRPEPPPAALTR